MVPPSDVPHKDKKISPYFNFCKQRRNEVKAQLQAAGQPTSTAALSKALSAQWRTLSAQKKQEYCGSTSNLIDGTKEATSKILVRREHADKKEDDQEHAAQEVNDDIVAEENGGGSCEETEDGSCKRDCGHALAFPLSRVKRIIKADRDIKVIAADASVLVAIASQIFLERLTSMAHDAAVRRKRKTVRLQDIQAACKSEPRVDEFLSDALAEVLPRPAYEHDSDHGNDDCDGDGADAVVAAKPQNRNQQKKRRISKQVDSIAGNCHIADFFSANVASK